MAIISDAVPPCAPSRRVSAPVGLRDLALEAVVGERGRQETLNHYVAPHQNNKTTAIIIKVVTIKYTNHLTAVDSWLARSNKIRNFGSF